MSSVVCVKEMEGQGDPGEKLSQDELLCRTREVMQGLEALRAEHQAILEGLMGTLRCLKQSQEGHAVEEKTTMIQRSLEMLELGLSEAQVHCGKSLNVSTLEQKGGSKCFYEEVNLKVMLWLFFLFSIHGTGDDGSVRTSECSGGRETEASSTGTHVNTAPHKN